MAAGGNDNNDNDNNEDPDDDDKIAAGGNDNNDNDKDDDDDDDDDDKMAAGDNDNNDSVNNKDDDDDGDDKMAAGGNDNNDNDNNKDPDDDDDDKIAAGDNDNNDSVNNKDPDDDDKIAAGGNNNNINDDDDDDDDKSGLNGLHWKPPIGKRRSISIYSKTQNVHHDDDDDDDTSDYDGKFEKVNNVIVDNDDVDDDVDDVVKIDDDDTSAYDIKVDNVISNNDNVSNNVNFYNNLVDYTDTDTDDDDEDNDEDDDAEEFNDCRDNTTSRLSLCDYGKQHSSTLVIGKQVKYTKLEREVFRLNRLSNLHPLRRERSPEIKNQISKQTKRVQQLATALNMNGKTYWSKHFGDFYILPKNGHYIPHVGGSKNGVFENTRIKATVITDELVIHIFQVWLKKYCNANGKRYKPRDNLLYTDLQKLAQMRADIPHLDPNTRAGFTDEMELVQMMIEDGEIHILIDGTDVTGGDNNRVRISKLVMSNQISKDGSKLEPSNRQKNRPTRHIFAFNCFSQAYLATPEDVVAGRIPILWYPPYEKDHANGKGGDNTMRNMNLKESSDNKTAFIKSRDKEKK